MPYVAKCIQGAKRIPTIGILAGPNCLEPAGFGRLSNLNRPGDAIRRSGPEPRANVGAEPHGSALGPVVEDDAAWTFVAGPPGNAEEPSCIR